MTAQQKNEKNDSVKKLQVDPVSSLNNLKISDHLLVERADEAQLKAIFDKYASYSHHNQPAMKSEDLIQKYLGLLSTTDFNEKTLRILANLVDINKDGYITFDEFKRFEELLCSPDVLFKCAFQLFDIKGLGLVTFDNFKEIIDHTLVNQSIPFDFDCEFVSNHFGKDRLRQINYQEFTQLIHDFHGEHAIQAFRSFDTKKIGQIMPQNFEKILLQLKSHLLSPFVRENLENLISNSASNEQISYPFFVGFIYLLNNMELIKKIFLACTNDHPSMEITRGQFLKEAQTFSQITPLEINILFLMVRGFRNDEKLTLKDIEKICPPTESFMPYRVKARIAEENFNILNRGVGSQVAESAYKFFLGSIAGAVGAFAVYPIDLVKTRMQNQRSKAFVGEVMYRNSLDCFKKVIRHEGFLGLYKGLSVQLIGVAPEKAIKLTVNDLVRSKIIQYNGSLPLSGEAFAGGMAGMCQVIFTNPMEIIKIRMQVAGEIQSMAKSEKLGKIIKDIGFVGMYKGVRACLLRDIPFSMIYFPAYSHMKTVFQDDQGHNSPLSLFYAGFLAGVPAAGLVTPADVIKTRIQVKERAGAQTYKGIIDAFRKINIEEGPTAFWKGTGARIFRSSPQFGVTLVSYELLQRYCYVDFGGRKPEGSEITQIHELKAVNIESRNPEHIGGYKLANVTFGGLESKFGICFPKINKAA